MTSTHAVASLQDSVPSGRDGQGGTTASTLVLIFDATQAGQRVAAAALVPTLAGAHRVRCVPAQAAIGRDVLEAARIVFLGWQVPAHLPHLRELLLQRRGRVAVVVDAAAPGTTSALVAQLRRFAGAVFTSDATLAAELTRQLLVPVVTAASCELGAAIAQACCAEVEDLDAVATHLRHAHVWLQRSDLDGAFAAAGRALKLAPDSAELVADVGRILARLGRGQEALELCRAFLRQRPAAMPVTVALAELQAT